MSTDESISGPSRPQSAVSGGVGLAGLAGLAIWVTAAIRFGMDGPYAALASLIACGAPMVLWSIFVDKVYRNPTTGLDWGRPPRSVAGVADVSLVKLVGLWATWALIAVLYCIFRFYWRGDYLFAMAVFAAAALPLFIVSVPYIFWIDRRLVEPREGAWHLGAFLLGQPGVKPDQVWSHLRAWAVKGFFLAFMISIVPGSFHELVDADFTRIRSDPVALSQWLITLMFVVDIAFATLGYVMTMKPLDAHIRSAMPYASGWAAALICYPPFILMGAGGPLDYHTGAQDWL